MDYRLERSEGDFSLIILGLESSCDETAASIVRDGKEILSNVVSSQIDLHQKFGGVVPEIASREHLERFLPVLEKALKDAEVKLEDIDGIAVSFGPGLIGALMVGLQFAKALALSLKKPFMGINHLQAHLYASSMDKEIPFPALGVVISGGHTALLKMNSIEDFEPIGQTMDDAIGEAFDKCANILGLSYPGGPAIEKLAKDGDPRTFHLKAGKVKAGPLNFSFSGLKTQILYAAKGQSAHKNAALIIDETQKADLAAAFQKTAFDDLLSKIQLACTEEKFKAVVFGGGVCNNKTLREEAKKLKLPLCWPSLALSLDNAAMIAGLGYQKFIAKPEGHSFDLEANSRLGFQT